MKPTRTLRALTGVLLAGAVALVGAPAAHADNIRDLQMQWPLKDFNVQNIWRITTGSGVKVAVIDSGIDASHPDLTGQILPGTDARHGGDGRKDYDPEKHGTSMASIIAGHGHGSNNSDGVVGLAPGVKILPVAKFGADGTNGTGRAIHYAVDHGASVISMSIGGVDEPPDLREAVAYAQRHDVVLIAASGNEASSQENFPAALPGVVAVGAVDKGLRVWRDSNYGSYLALTAPGVDVTSATTATASGYGSGTGTSDATAFVSAAAALIRAKYPDLTAGQVVNRLVKTAYVPEELKGRKLPDPHYGYGIIRPYKALTADIPPGPEEGPLPRAAAPGASAGSGTTPQSGAPAPSGNGPGTAAAQDDGLSTGALVGIAAGGVALLVVVVVVIAAVSRGRRRPPGGPGGPQGPGGGHPGTAPPYPPQPWPAQAQPGGYPPPQQQYPLPYGQPQPGNPYAQGGYGQPPQQH
ncbi:S8 family serine peptidase [Streptomyces sp. NPDC001380]|uniref:S8 family serine peptidase n=1 Tax=Streptomyces sp. NPDC001380 TaxID=3364566 RepID=UPI0036CE15BB